MIKELEALSAANAKAISEMSKTVADTKNFDRLMTNQKDIVKLLGKLSNQNTDIQRLFKERDNRVSYP